MWPIVVGVAGGSASGKTSVVQRLVEGLGTEAATVLQHDRYYHDRSALTDEARAALNYDHPDALDSDLLLAHLAALRAGLAIEAPVYDLARHARQPWHDLILPRPTLIVEGILVLADARLRAAMDIRVFVDTDDESRFRRRLARDVKERGRSAESVAAQYAATVRPMHDAFVEPSRLHADLVVTGGAHNTEAVRQLLVMVAERIKS
jgi:uridine kinase